MPKGRMKHLQLVVGRLYSLMRASVSAIAKERYER